MFKSKSSSVARDVLVEYNLIATDLYSSHIYKPFIYPYYALGPYLVVAYLLIPPISPNSPISKPVFYLRYPLFALVTYISVSAIRECRTATVSVGYGIGLISAWTMLWAATLIIFGDARGDYNRFEKKTGVHNGVGETPGWRKDITGHAESKGPEIGGEIKELRKRVRNGDIITPGSDKGSNQHAISITSTYIVSQHLPTTFSHRLCWVTDLVTSFRGINWTYGPFEPTYHSTRPPSPYSTPPSYIPSRRTLLLNSTISLLVSYILLDLLKTLTLLDPYYTGRSPSTPSPFPFPSISRLLLSLFSTYTALGAIFALAPFISQLLGPAILGPYADPELYPPYFGSLSHISNKGLAGLWGGAWHPLFRLAFEAAGDFCAAPLGPAWGRRYARGKALRLFVAFFLSGYLHACGSYTTLPATQPLSRAFLFFALQPLGILAQGAITCYVPASTPPWARKAGNWAFTAAWALATGPLIADDFAACGIWLFEPVPFSLWRGGRWCWSGGWVRVWKAERWWERGLAF